MQLDLNRVLYSVCGNTEEKSCHASGLIITSALVKCGWSVHTQMGYDSLLFSLLLHPHHPANDFCFHTGIRVKSSFQALISMNAQIAVRPLKLINLCNDASSHLIDSSRTLNKQSWDAVKKGPTAGVIFSFACKSCFAV